MVAVTVLTLTSYVTLEFMGETGSATTSVDYTPMWLQSAAAGLAVMFPIWIPVVVLVAISSLWNRRQKNAHILLLPMVVVLIALLPDLGWLIAGEPGLNAAAWLGIAASIQGGGWVLFRLTARGMARSHALSARQLARS